MFRAVKAMKSIPRPPSLSVQDPEGKFFATDKAKADAICRWFEQQFTDPTVAPLLPFVGPGQPLKQPITASEVERAMKLLRNGRAPGPDGISNELLKYAAGILSESFAEIINAIFEQHARTHTMRTHTHMHAHLTPASSAIIILLIIYNFLHHSKYYIM